MSETQTTVPAENPTRSFIARVLAAAVALWHKLVSIEQDLLMVEHTHPEIVAAAAVLEAEAPPAVRVGIETAKVLARAVNDIIVHAQDVEEDQATAKTAPGATAGSAAHA